MHQRMSPEEFTAYLEKVIKEPASDETNLASVNRVRAKNFDPPLSMAEYLAIMDAPKPSLAPAPRKFSTRFKAALKAFIVTFKQR